MDGSHLRAPKQQGPRKLLIPKTSCGPGPDGPGKPFRKGACCQAIFHIFLWESVFTASPSSSFPRRQFLIKKQHGLKNTIPAKRSTCLCPCSVCAALHPFLPLLSLGVQRLQSLELAYPTHNCSCLGKMGFQKDLVLLRKCSLLADGLCYLGERFPSGDATDNISLGSVLPTQWVSLAQLSVPLRRKMKRGKVC